MEQIDEDIQFLKAPANFVITGVTGSGKTYFLLKLLTEWPFKIGKNRIIYFYNVWQQLFEEFLRQFPNITFIEGLNLDMIENGWEEKENSVNVCIVDDLADIALKSEPFARLFTVYGHHRHIVNFFLTQNLFFKGPLATTINRNAHYFILTKSPHLNMIETLNHQLYGRNGPLKMAYVNCMKDKPYNYLVVDVFCDNVCNRLRSNIFSNEKPMIIWRNA